MLFNMRRELNQKLFNFMTASVRNKLRVKVNIDSNFVILTQLCSSDINMYLVAMASFCKYLKPKSVVVVADRLTVDETALLVSCVEGLTIIPIADATSPDLPKGGCWERLITIHRLLSDSYVVQLDADTVTLNYLAEVAAAINENRSFTLATKMGYEKWTLAETSDKVVEINGGHVQLLAEKSFSKMVEADTRLYVRGCAGFAGYGKNSATLDSLIKFSSEIEGIIGKGGWHQWGSEQVASNYVVANVPGSVILPFDKYPYYEVGLSLNTPKFLHFIGGSRYKRGVYIMLSRKIISHI